MGFPSGILYRLGVLLLGRMEDNLFFILLFKLRIIPLYFHYREHGLGTTNFSFLWVNSGQETRHLVVGIFFYALNQHSKDGP